MLGWGQVQGVATSLAQCWAPGAIFSPLNVQATRGEIGNLAAQLVIGR